MLIHPHDAALSDDEWRDFLATHDFGQVIAPGAAIEMPVIAPTHFVFDGANTLEMHFHRANPVLKAIEESPRAIFSVIGSYTYIPTSWNADPGTDPEWGVPTSYYAAVQATTEAAIVDDPVELAALLSRLLSHFQPEGGHYPVEAGDNPYGKLLGAIRGVRLTISSVRAKFKFGNNKSSAQRLDIAERLERRASGLDLEAREHLLRRLREGSRR
ncbi:MAG: FMN-binding negative transcriptional regulator [Acidobacteriota bacterium]|nr:FMN-binding negative transcriptional regulator [Acidobacteriota bacterium]